jgi:LacI family transcriptional regulator
MAALSWFDPRFIGGIGHYAREAGWHLEARSMLEATYPADWHGDGIIIQNSAQPRLQEFIGSHARRQPTVLLGARVAGLDLPIVTADNRRAGQLAARHFLDRGYHNCVWIGANGGKFETDRRTGFVDTLTEAGRLCAVLNLPSGLTLSADWNLRKKWLQAELRNLPRPTGAFVVDDLVAADVVACALAVGLKVPEEVAVIGVGNIETLCECSAVPLSSVDLNPGEMAYRAAELLDRVMQGQAPPTRPIVVPVRNLVLRKSSDTLAINHPGLARALRYITAHHVQDIGIDEIARAAGMCRRGIHYAFGRELRCTPADYLLGARLEAAKRRITEGKGKLDEIAAECGFKTARNLHRCFIRAVGLAPRAWRSQHATERIAELRETSARTGVASMVTAGVKGSETKTGGSKAAGLERDRTRGTYGQTRSRS